MRAGTRDVMVWREEMIGVKRRWAGCICSRHDEVRGERAIERVKGRGRWRLFRLDTFCPVRFFGLERWLRRLPAAGEATSSLDCDR